MYDECIVLVDYDNIEKIDRTDNQKLEKTLFSYINRTKKYKRIVFKYYGGWFYYRTESFAAQSLIPWIHSYPHVIDNTILDAELVRSLAFERHDLPFTFRTRSKRLAIQIDTSKICRNDSTCDLFIVNRLLRNRRCRDPNCLVSYDEIFLQNEQKLVDTMIATDLIYFSNQNRYDLFLCSSDDDFIPPIRYLGYQGKVVNVIHTKSNPYSFRSDYVIPFNTNINEGCLK